MPTPPSSNLVAYPAVGLAACVSLGILCAAHLPFSKTLSVVLLGAASSLLVVYALLGHRRRLVSPRPLLLTLAAMLLFVTAGIARYRDGTAAAPAHIAQHLPELDDATVTAVLRVDGPVRYGPERFQFTGSIDHILHASDDTLADTLHLNGRLLVTAYIESEGNLSTAVDESVENKGFGQGDRVVITGRFRAVRPRGNPADPDFGAYLKRRGIYASLTVYNAADVQVWASTSALTLRGIVALRRHVGNQIEALVPEASSQVLLRTLLLGDRQGLDPSVRVQFVQTGLMHVLAVSGLHVMLVGMVVYVLLRSLLLRLGWRRVVADRVRALVTVFILLLYLSLVGFSASVLRAVCMASLFIGQDLLQRDATGLNPLGVAATLMLLAWPTLLFDVGFQLSFTAVGGILLLRPVLVAACPASWQAHAALRYTLDSLTVSLAATLGTLPVLLWHFGFVSFAGLVLNLIAIPAVMLTLTAGLLMVVTGLPAFGWAAHGCATILQQTAAWGAQYFQVLTLSTYVDSMWMIGALLASLGVLAAWHRPRWRWRLGIAALVSLAGFAVDHDPNTPGPADLDVLVFDVGQGDATLIRFPNGTHLLIDAGVRTPYTDAGRRTLLPHLQRYGIDALDAVVITHPHSDHLGGLPALLREVPIRQVLHNGSTYTSALTEEVAHLLDSLAVPHRAVAAGDTLDLDPRVRLRVLAPFPGTQHRSVNDGSVVVALHYGATSMLFMGDAEAETEQTLVAAYDTLLACDAIKVGHHGSRTSSLPAFVERVAASPTVAVVSAGLRNRFGLPDEDVLLRWFSAGATIALTSQDGAIRLRSNGQQIRRVVWR